jgi:hypothetical protein
MRTVALGLLGWLLLAFLVGALVADETSRPDPGFNLGYDMGQGFRYLVIPTVVTLVALTAWRMRRKRNARG